MVADTKAPIRVTLGSVYEDSLTGFVGTATSRHTSKNGCVQVAIRPRVGEDNRYSKGEWIFETQLIDHETRLAIDSKPEPEVLALLDKEYVDKKTGFKGIAVGYVELLNGTVQLDLTPKVKSDGSMIDTYGIDLQDLTDTKTKKPADAPVPRRGAPTQRVDRPSR